MGIRPIQQEVREDGMKVRVADDIGIGGIVIRPLYGLRPLGMMPMSFKTF